MALSAKDCSAVERVESVIRTNGEVFVEYHTRQTDDLYYLISDIDDVIALYRRLEPFELLTFFKQRQLPIRGTLDESLRAQIRDAYTASTSPHYLIVKSEKYPASLDICGCGATITELLTDLRDGCDRGTAYLFGNDPRLSILPRAIDESDQIIVVVG